MSEGGASAHEPRLAGIPHGTHGFTAAPLGLTGHTGGLDATALVLEANKKIKAGEDEVTMLKVEEEADKMGLDTIEKRDVSSAKNFTFDFISFSKSLM